MSPFGGAALTSLSCVFLCSVGVLGLSASELRDADVPRVNLPTVAYDFRNQVDCCYCGMDVRVTVRPGSDGRVETLVRGESVPYRELVWKLLVFAERKRDLEHPLQPSEVGVIIRADRDLPWWAVRRSPTPARIPT